MSPGRSSASPKIDMKPAATVPIAWLISRVRSRNCSRSRPAAQQRGGALGELEVVLGEHPLVRVDRRGADGAARLGEEVEVEPGHLGELALRVARLLRREHALDREQRQPALRGGLAQLLQREAVLLERAQQVEARLARACSSSSPSSSPSASKSIATRHIVTGERG